MMVVQQMITLIVAARDNITLRLESDDPSCPSWLNVVADKLNDEMEAAKPRIADAMFESAFFGSTNVPVHE